MASNGSITWFAHYDADQECYDIATSEKPDEDGSFEKVIATVWANRPSLKATANQDARLIAAAPELLAALKDIIDNSLIVEDICPFCGRDVTDDGVKCMASDCMSVIARAAIAKATGNV